MQHVLQSGNCLKGQCINFFDTFPSKKPDPRFPVLLARGLHTLPGKIFVSPYIRVTFSCRSLLSLIKSATFVSKSTSLSASLLLQAYNFSLRELLSPSKRTTISSDKSSTPPCKNTTSPGNLHFSMQKGRHFCAIVPHLHACFPKIV